MFSDIIKITVGVIMFFVFLLWGGNQFSDALCHASTAGMKTSVEYGFLSGCRVGTPDGRMVPLEVYREFKEQQ